MVDIAYGDSKDPKIMKRLEDFKERMGNINKIPEYTFHDR